MSISLSDASLKTYRQLLPASLAIMKKAEKYFTDEGANLNDLAEMRLIEDMAPLTFQVFSVVHHSVGAIDALKTGEFAPPKMPENLSFNDLIDMLENAEEKLNLFSDDDINSLSGKEIMFKMGQIEWAHSICPILNIISFPEREFISSSEKRFNFSSAFSSISIRSLKLKFSGIFGGANSPVFSASMAPTE